MSRLPTAPRSSQDAVDMKNLPTAPPYTAFLGNLAFDVEEEDITEFFGDLKVIYFLSLLNPLAIDNPKLI